MSQGIIIKSFYTDLKIIESTIHICKLHDIKVEPDLIETLKEFKFLLYSGKNINDIGAKYMDLAEKYYILRKEIYDEGEEDFLIGDISNKKKVEDMLKSYV
ncbi:MAG: hypothetical protein JSV49_10965 [Thermoplasmata archaeon]|nr:MAG: hypothetical protein JSV49_10965 [Thermoplasmata archaeon]